MRQQFVFAVNGPRAVDIGHVDPLVGPDRGSRLEKLDDSWFWARPRHTSLASLMSRPMPRLPKTLQSLPPNATALDVGSVLKRAGYKQQHALSAAPSEARGFATELQMEMRTYARPFPIPTVPWLLARLRARGILDSSDWSQVISTLHMVMEQVSTSAEVAADGREAACVLTACQQTGFQVPALIGPWLGEHPNAGSDAFWSAVAQAAAEVGCERYVESAAVAGTRSDPQTGAGTGKRDSHRFLREPTANAQGDATARMDKSIDYAHAYREGGRFGSHPSHDDYDEESDS